MKLDSLSGVVFQKLLRTLARKLRVLFDFFSHNKLSCNCLRLKNFTREMSPYGKRIKKKKLRTETFAIEKIKIYYCDKHQYFHYYSNLKYNFCCIL